MIETRRIGSRRGIPAISRFSGAWLCASGTLLGGACLAVASPAAVNAGATRATDVGPGEIRVDGTVSAVDATNHVLTLAVTSYILPGGHTYPLNAPKLKRVVLGARTSLHQRDAANVLFLEGIKPGAPAFATGKEMGNGSDLPAREVAVEVAPVIAAPVVAAPEVAPVIAPEVAAPVVATPVAAPVAAAPVAAAPVAAAPEVAATDTADTAQVSDDGATDEASGAHLLLTAAEDADVVAGTTSSDMDGVLLAQGDVPGTVLPGSPPAGQPVNPGPPGTGATGTSSGATPGAGAPGGPPGGPGMGPGGPSPFDIADFLIAIDRPFDAEKIYQGMVSHAGALPPPMAARARKGLERAKIAEGPTLKVLTHNYTDSHDVIQVLQAAGVIFHTTHGDIGLYGSTGHYKNNINPDNPRNPLAFLAGPEDDQRFNRNAVVFDATPRYGKIEGRVFLTQVNYSDPAPNRFLYDLELGYVPKPPRQHYTLTVARRDNILQSGQAPFFGAESFVSLVSGLRIEELSASVAQPIGGRVDLEGYSANFHYKDPTLAVGSNVRNTYRASIYYRILSPKNPIKPVFRLGLGYINDDTKFPSAAYYAPQKVQSGSLQADYAVMGRKMQYGLFGSLPIARDRGTGFIRHDPPKILFGFLNYNVTKRYQLFTNISFFRSPKSVKADNGGIIGGRDLDFNDFIFGLNTQF